MGQEEVPNVLSVRPKRSFNSEELSMPARIIGKKRKFKPKIIMDHLQRSWSMIRIQGFE
jgi:hypothetical protein